VRATNAVDARDPVPDKAGWMARANKSIAGGPFVAKGYWIVNNIIHDTETYEKYKAANAAPLAAFGARFLVRAGNQDIREGTANPRTVVIEFPSYADAIDCYESDAYQQAISVRLPAAEGSHIIVEGYDG